MPEKNVAEQNAVSPISVSRRDFLRLSTLIPPVAALAACGPTQPDATASAAATAPALVATPEAESRTLLSTELEINETFDGGMANQTGSILPKAQNHIKITAIPELITTPEIPKPPTLLDLTYFWDANVYELEPSAGQASIRAALFIEKRTKFNYGRRSPGEIPGNDTVLTRNSKEALVRFGTQILKPGDELVFADIINPSDKLLPGETQYGQGFFGNGNGMCNASTALAEAFGIEVKLPGGFYVPLFIARPGAIQPHDMDHNPEYYDYVYHGPGVAFNTVFESGKLRFGVNPNLPADLEVKLTTSYIDTNPENTLEGWYKPLVQVDITGLSDGSSLRYQRLTADRKRVVTTMTGSQEYWSTRGQSVYYDTAGNMIKSSEPILPPIPFEPQKVISVKTATPPSTILYESYLGATTIPESQINNYVYPRGYARGAEHLIDGSVIWNHHDDWLLPDPIDLPLPIQVISPQEYLRILRWNNVGHKDNIRYKQDGTNTGCNIAAVDWAHAFVIADFFRSAPLPRWLNREKFDANDLYDFLATEEASIMGWVLVDSRSAQSYANKGNLTFGTVKNNTRSSGHIAAISPGAGIELDGQFYPSVADGGWNWGPDEGKTAYDSFEHARERPQDYSEIKYYSWVPPMFNE